MFWPPEILIEFCAIGNQILSAIRRGIRSSSGIWALVLMMENAQRQAEIQTVNRSLMKGR